MSKKAVLLFLLLSGIIAVAAMAVWGYYAPTCYMKAHDGLPEVCSSRKDTIRIPFVPPILGIYADVFSNVAWSPDGKKVFMLHTGTPNVKVWDIERDITIDYDLSYIGAARQTLAFLNNNNVLLPFRPFPPTQQYWGFQLWNAETRKFDKSIPSQYPDRDFEYSHYALSTDKTLLAAMSSGDSGVSEQGRKAIFGENPIPVYSTKTWEIIHLLPAPNPQTVAISPDSMIIAVGSSYGRVFLFDAASGQLSKVIQAYENDIRLSVEALSFSPDGQFLATGVGIHNSPHHYRPVRVVRVADGAVVASYDEDMGSIERVNWSLDGKYIVFPSHGRKLRFWNPQVPDDHSAIIPGIRSMCQTFSPDGKRLAVCNDDKLILFNLK